MYLWSEVVGSQGGSLNSSDVVTNTGVLLQNLLWWWHLLHPGTWRPNYSDSKESFFWNKPLFLSTVNIVHRLFNMKLVDFLNNSRTFATWLCSHSVRVLVSHADFSPSLKWHLKDKQAFVQPCQAIVCHKGPGREYSPSPSVLHVQPGDTRLFLAELQRHANVFSRPQTPQHLLLLSK